MQHTQIELKAEYREQLYQALEKGSEKTVTDLIRGLHPSEIADSLEAMPREFRPMLWRLVPLQDKGEVLWEAHKEVRQQLIDNCEHQELLVALSTLEMDELAVFLGE